jgi:hypothetical protein
MPRFFTKIRQSKPVRGFVNACKTVGTATGSFVKFLRPQKRIDDALDGYSREKQAQVHKIEAETEQTKELLPALKQKEEVNVEWARSQVRLSEIKEVNDLIDVYKKAREAGVNLMVDNSGRLTLRELQQTPPSPRVDVQLAQDRLLEAPDEKKTM